MQLFAEISTPTHGNIFRTNVFKVRHCESRNFPGTRRKKIVRYRKFYFYAFLLEQVLDFIIILDQIPVGFYLNIAFNFGDPPSIAISCLFYSHFKPPSSHSCRD